MRMTKTLSICERQQKSRTLVQSDLYALSLLSSPLHTGQLLEEMQMSVKPSRDGSVFVSKGGPYREGFHKRKVKPDSTSERCRFTIYDLRKKLVRLSVIFQALSEEILGLLIGHLETDLHGVMI